jgi:hypothetical protein
VRRRGCGGVRVRTVTVMSLLFLLWIAFAGVSSSRSCLGVAAGIWSSGVFSMTSLEGRCSSPHAGPDEPKCFDEPALRLEVRSRCYRE